MLVDDASTHDWLKGPLEQHISLLPKVRPALSTRRSSPLLQVRIVRLPRRSGLVVARLKGIEEAKGEVFVVLDSHIEVQPVWLEPLVCKFAAVYARSHWRSCSVLRRTARSL